MTDEPTIPTLSEVFLSLLRSLGRGVVWLFYLGLVLLSYSCSWSGQVSSVLDDSVLGTPKAGTGAGGAPYDTGRLRRVHLPGHDNILKRVLLHGYVRISGERLFAH